VTAPAPAGSFNVNAIRDLLTPEAVRARCGEIFDRGLEDGLPGFRIDLERMEDATTRVVTEIQTHYPALDVPFHSRWRHFEFDGIDLWKKRVQQADMSGTALTAAAGDLAIISVLLDAGAGADWTYRDQETGLCLGRSEGLALASLRLFEAGTLSADPEDPLRADASALKALTAEQLGDAFQAGPDNPLVGLAQRAGLLQRLGSAVEDRPEIFGRNGTARPGNLLATLADLPAGQSGVKARDILIAILDGLMPVWPSPIRIDGIPLGDVGRHAAIVRQDETNGIVPFHKLSQWLSYSLIEPLQHAGIDVENLDGLTGLPEYRNGGLFVDTGVLTLKEPGAAMATHDPADALIVEWRALTVCLLDRIAEDVRTALGRNAEQLPLASVLQGGTWAAGRRIAAEKRPDGPPPILIKSDATVF
jgi:hypothetical protein